MNLNDFVSKKEKEKKEYEDEDLKITEEENKTKYYFKNKKAIKKINNLSMLSLSEAIITDNEEIAKKHFKKAIKNNTEGLMAKSLNAKYSPGLRTGNLAKIKETKEDIDAVIIGAEHGKGKRAGFYSSFLVALKDEEEPEKLLTVGKVSSGIKEIEQEEGISLKEITEKLRPLKISQKGEIDYFEPKIILQIKYQEIMESNTYNSGIALRFPRIITIRTDKDITEINSIQELKKF